MTKTLDLPRRYREELLSLLETHVPATEVWAYGSRVTGANHEGSDLDIVLRGPELQKLGSEYLDLLDAIEESTIPILIDVFDWARLPPSFHSEIERQHVVLRQRRRLRLDDVAEVVMGQSPPSETVSDDDGTPLLNGPTEFGSHHPVPVQFTNDVRRYALKGDILFCVRGSTTGRMNWADRRYAIGRGIAAIRHRSDPRLQPFVRGVIERELPSLLSSATGSTFPNVSAKQIGAVAFPCLGLKSQEQVASALGALDDRVELNRRMCETLEEMAQALYKEWFVDFEPVRAKMEGRWREGESLPGLPAETYQIFPSQLVDSRLGTVPAGWNIEQLGDAIELEYGKALKASERKYGRVPVYGSNGQIGWHDAHLVKGPGIIVGRKGNPGTVRRSQADFFPIDTTFYAVARGAGLTFEYLYYMLQRQQLPSVTSDSAVPGLNRNLVYGNLYARPSDDAIAAFTEAVSGLWSCEQSIQASSQLLGDLRDALLPKLISGELRVSAPAAGQD